MATIQKIYIALFGRPADPIGLDFFDRLTKNGHDLTGLSGMIGSNEYLSRFEGMNNAQVITAIYVALFNRNPDVEGLAFFLEELSSGRQTIETIAIHVLDGARGADLAMIAAKLAAADLFTDLVRLNNDALGRYQSTEGIAFGTAFLDQLHDGIQLLDALIRKQVDAFAETGDGFGSQPEPTPQPPVEPQPPIVPEPEPQPVGQTYTLRASSSAAPNDGDESIVADDGDDLFRAITSNSLNSADRLDGGAGNDTLQIGVDAYLANASPTLVGIERITNISTANLDLSAASGVEAAWSTGASASYSGASISTTFGISLSAAGALRIDFADGLSGTADTIPLAVKDNVGDFTTLVSPDANLIEKATIAALGSHASDNYATADRVSLLNLVYLNEVTITGGGDLWIIINSIVTSTVDAREATGNLYIQSTSQAAMTTALLGSGNDLVNFFNKTGPTLMDGGTGRDQMFGGTGNDTFVMNGGDSANGRSGNDTFQITNGLDPAALNLIAAFTNATHDLDFAGPAGSASNYLESTATVWTFAEARDAAASHFAQNASLAYVAMDISNDVAVFYGDAGTLHTSAYLTGVQFAAIDHTAFV